MRSLGLHRHTDEQNVPPITVHLSSMQREWLLFGEVLTVR